MIFNLAVGPRDFKETTSIMAPIGFSGKSDFPLIVVGRRTEIVSASVQDSPQHPEISNVHVGAFCSLATEITLMINMNHDYLSVSTSAYFPDQDNFKIRRKGQLIIQNDVYIGHHTMLMSGVKIGNGAVIAAGTVVTKDVPPYAIVGGSPQKIIKYRFEPTQIEKLLAIQWWNWRDSELEDQRQWFHKDINAFIDRFYEAGAGKNPPTPLPMKRKGTAFLFFPDFFEPYSVWERVLAEYRTRFTADDDVTLILRLKQDERFAQAVRLVEASRTANEPDILIINDDLPDERALFYGVDYFITTRNKNTIQLVEYADTAKVRILSGVDRPVFDR